MTLYPWIVTLHVLAAVLGLGQITVIAFAAKNPTWTPLLSRLGIGVSVSLVIMLLTGGALIGLTHGVWAQQNWLRASLVFFFVLGGLNGLVARSLKAQALKRASYAAWVMVSLVGVLVVLMQAKPF